MSFYAVAIGRRIGIYTTWPSCEEQVKGFKGAKYKKFPTRSEADVYFKQYSFSNSKSQYKPEDHTVPLGAKFKAKQVEYGIKKSEDLWPPSDGDDFVTDEDLLMTLAKVEGLPQESKNRKRKADSHISITCNKIPKHESIICEPVGLKDIKGTEFLVDSDGYVIVYTDGSCINNGQKNACAGYGVYFGDNHVLNVGKPVSGGATNNVGEIQAAIYAIKTAKTLGISKLCVCTDSQFLINSVTLWMKTGSLRKSGHVENVAEFKELNTLLQDKSIDVKWANLCRCAFNLWRNCIKANKGIKDNEMVDRLAREGLDIYRSMSLKEKTFKTLPFEEQMKCFKDAKCKNLQRLSEEDTYLKEHFFSNSKNQCKREDHIVSMGTKVKEKQLEDVNKKSEDLWPPSDGDEFITDEDLLMALTEVEGLPQTLENTNEKAESHTGSTSSHNISKLESITWEPAGLKHIRGMQFLLDSEGYVIVYTDGSCFNNGQKNACAGYGVYFGDNHVLNVGKPVIGRATNNVGEIQAAIYAIKTAKTLGITKLCLCTDSQFLINSVTLWMKGWKVKNWRLKGGGPVKNAIEFKELDNLLQDKAIEVKWDYVKAHQGIKGNEMADKLAREGSEIYRSMHLKK